MLNSINLLVNFVQIWQKVISLVTMATNIDRKLLTIVFLFLSGTDHSVKVSSIPSRSVPGPYWIFWWLQRFDVLKVSLRSAGVFVQSLRPRLCGSLRVFACFCASLRVFACLCVVWVSLKYLDRPLSCAPNDKRIFPV